MRAQGPVPSMGMRLALACVWAQRPHTRCRAAGTQRRAASLAREITDPQGGW